MTVHTFVVELIILCACNYDKIQEKIIHSTQKVMLYRQMKFSFSVAGKKHKRIGFWLLLCVNLNKLTNFKEKMKLAIWETTLSKCLSYQTAFTHTFPWLGQKHHLYYFPFKSEVLDLGLRLLWKIHTKRGGGGGCFNKIWSYMSFKVIVFPYTQENLILWFKKDICHN